MDTRPWRHPKHKQLAGLGTLLNFVALMLGIGGVDLVSAFRNRLVSKGTHTTGGESYTMVQMKVDCTDHLCVEKSTEANWQLAGMYLIMAGLGINGLTCGLQVVIFWPMVYFSKVVHPLLRVCQIVDFIGSYGKFIGGMIFVFQSSKINRHYRWQKKHGLFELHSLPLALILFSFVVHVLSGLLMILVQDNGPPGGPTHGERIHGEIEHMKLMEAERKESRLRRKSSFVPANTHGHINTHA